MLTCGSPSSCAQDEEHLLSYCGSIRDVCFLTIVALGSFGLYCEKPFDNLAPKSRVTSQGTDTIQRGLVGLPEDS